MSLVTKQSFIKPEAIIFDLSEVYLSGLLGTHERLGRHIHQPVETDVFLNDEITKLFHGEITEAEYWQHTINHNNWNVTVAELKTMVRENFKPIEGTEKVIKELKHKKYRLGLLSVHAKEWIEYCEQQFDYQKFFDVCMYSYEHRVSKPDPKSYRLILEALGVNPENSVFIDDSSVNIEAAESIGMTAFQFIDADRLRSDLLQANIL